MEYHFESKIDIDQLDEQFKNEILNEKDIIKRLSKIKNIGNLYNEISKYIKIDNQWIIDMLKYELNNNEMIIKEFKKHLNLIIEKLDKKEYYIDEDIINVSKIFKNSNEMVKYHLKNLDMDKLYQNFLELYNKIDNFEDLDKIYTYLWLFEQVNIIIYLKNNIKIDNNINREYYYEKYLKYSKFMLLPKGFIDDNDEYPLSFYYYDMAKFYNNTKYLIKIYNYCLKEFKNDLVKIANNERIYFTRSFRISIIISECLNKSEFEELFIETYKKIKNGDKLFMICKYLTTYYQNEGYLNEIILNYQRS